MTVHTMVDAPPAPESCHRLARCYSALARGLYYPGSESDSPFLPFACAYEGTRVTLDAFLPHLHLASFWEVDIRDGDAWLKEVIANYTADGDAEIVAAFSDLRKVMRATLFGRLSLVHAAPKPGLSAFHKARVYLVGTVRPSGIAGLMSYSVET
jgi:Nuclease A inhibitor-like protein